MPLPLPNLDTRRWADLVDEGRAMIPRYAPGWTDHNIHDPGITLIELFAWLTEIDIYRANQITARHRMKFLRLVGFNPQPPRAAQTVLTFSPEPGTLPFSIPAGAEFEATDSNNQSIPFRALRDLTVGVVELGALQVDAGDGLIVDWTRDWRDGLPITALGSDPRPGAALYLGFDTLPAETPIALSLDIAPPGGDGEARERLIRERAAELAACRHILPDIICEETEQPHPPPQMPPHHSAGLVWEVFTSSGTDPWTRLEPVADPAAPGVGQVLDDTRSLSLDGMVEINLPAAIIKTDLGKVGDEPRFYVRCRLQEGAYDAPPSLIAITANGVRAEQAVPVWQRFTIAAGVTPSGAPPAPGTTARLNMELDVSGFVTGLTFVDAASAPDHPDLLVLDYHAPAGGNPGHLTLRMAQAGRGNGRPQQRVTLPRAPVQLESLRLFTHSNNSWSEWTRRDDMDVSSRTDRHFAVDATSGEILGGDGERGRVFSAGALIMAAYRATRAAEGNVPTKRITRVASSPLSALWFDTLPGAVKNQWPEIMTNGLAARGGRAAEDLSAAAGRAVSTLHAHERLVELATVAKAATLDQIARDRVRAVQAPTRAVNLLDIERLALEVPGTEIARARAWSATHPAYACLETPGVVTLVVMPELPASRPEPSRGLLEAVKRYLERRRTICTRIEVVGPRYLEVRVKARVRTRQHADAGRVKADIRAALDGFLDPRLGGPDRLGWPFGRDVYSSEILQVIDGVAGVDHVLELSLSTESGQAQCGNLGVCPTWLVTPGEHEIEVA